MRSVRRRGATPSPTGGGSGVFIHPGSGPVAQGTHTIAAGTLDYRALFETVPVGVALTTLTGKIVDANERMCAMAGVTHAEALATPVSTFYRKPADRRRLLLRLSRSGGLDNCEVLLKRKDGSSLLGLAQTRLVRQGKRDYLLSIVQDITREKQIEQHFEGVADLLRLYATRFSRPEYLKAVLTLIQQRCGSHCVGVRLLDEQGCLPYAAQVGFNRAFLRHECKLSLHNTDCACLRVLRGDGSRQDAARTSCRGSFFCNSAADHIHEGGPTKRCVHVACLKAGYESLAHVPIRYREKLLGTIHVADPRPSRFPPEKVAFLETIAPLLGEALHRFDIEVSLQESEERFRSMFERHHSVMMLVEQESGRIIDANPAAASFYGYPRRSLRRMCVQELSTLPPERSLARRRKAAREERNVLQYTHRLANGEIRAVEVHSSPIRVAGRPLLFSIIHDVTQRKLLEKTVLDIGERERQRVGQDLHDSLGGKLAGAALLGKVLAQKLANQANPDSGLANEIVRAINDATLQTRLLARGLFPAELTVAGLAGGLAELAHEIERRFGVSCRLRSNLRRRIAGSLLTLHLFRIAQESVYNAIRHGKAKRISILLSGDRRRLRLEIRDNGKGMAAGENQGGLGMHTMAYRAGAIGAELKITPSRAGGTVVACTVPLTQEPALPASR